MLRRALWIGGVILLMLSVVLPAAIALRPTLQQGAVDDSDLSVFLMPVSYESNALSHLLEAIAASMGLDGTALITTPNVLQSDGVNPFHVHEYEAGELCELLQSHFERVEMLGVGMSPSASRYQADRLRRIRKIMKLDPFGLRDWLPRAWIDWLFARFSIVVRRGIQKGEGLPDLTVEDFPIGPADDGSLDLFAVCRGPRLPGDRDL